MNIKPKIVILSAELSSLCPVENSARTQRLKKVLTDLHLSCGNFSNIVEINGVYKGVMEDSFCISLKDDAWETELETLKGFALDNFGQEAVLFSDANRATELLFKDGQEFIGKLTSVSKEEAIQSENYSYKDVYNRGNLVRTDYFMVKRV